MNAREGKSLKGQCLCGSIKYEVDHIELRMGHCHCSMCRKFHGAAFATFGEALKDNFRWLEGTELLASYVAGNGTTRKFCRNCGSSMIFEASNYTGDLVEFALGTLDSNVDVQPDAHIFCDFKANWTNICDNLPQYNKGRDN